MNSANNNRYTTRLQKGGALLPDMRLLVRSWSDRVVDKTLQRSIVENILGKRSRARAIDTYRRAFVPRFVCGDPLEAWKLVQPLEFRNLPIEIIRPVYYWVTARSEPLLYDFVLEKLYEQASIRGGGIRTSEVSAWITSKLQEFRYEWSPTVTAKVARGILSALRDFGVLKGRAKKEIASAYLPLESFAYIAFALNKTGESGERLVTHANWRLFLLNPMGIESLFLQAHQHHFLSYQAAGKIVRISFPAESNEEMLDVLFP